MSSSFASNLIIDFFVALGMVVGGALLGGVAAVLTHSLSPLQTMVKLADQLKIWALVATLGGTMDTLRVIETGVLKAQLYPVGRQFALLVSAFLGSQMGFQIIAWLAGVASSDNG
ncbi:MAG: YtrH family sporulation protein [Thermoflavifilum sp.]|nr:YtrH family sporulation protein [Thermoflavifilum sp.]MCL6513653.1 YtrH family sporulation protein [Alicyclobacillus sp.]